MGYWWIDESHLLGSSNPTDEQLEMLYGQGCRTIVSLLNEEEQPPRYDVNRALALGYRRHSIPIPDFQAPTLDQVRLFVSMVAAIHRNEAVVVHCEGGVGRTGTMAAAYWIARGLPAEEAIRRVREACPHAVETTAQRSVLEEFAS